MRIKQFFLLIRPQQWLKNLFIFLPMFFSGNLLNAENLKMSLWAFIAFCATASAIYCINDIKDVEADRKHPKKCTRPIASGAVSVQTAIIITTILLLIGFSIAFVKLNHCSMYANQGGGIILSVYFLINIAYCFKLKQYAIIDVFIIALGFVLRLVLGGVVCDIWLSPWIVCLTFLLSLFIAFAKRRDDVIIHEEKGIVVRNNIVRYNSAFMNQTLGILASITIVCYIIYSVSPDVEIRLGSQYIYITSLFVLAGILRYLQLAIVEIRSGSPTKILLKDHFIQLSVIGWFISFFLIIYIFR